MPQIKKTYQEVRIPLANMSFTPDVPTAALAANEYNVGLNVETDVRGIRSVAGDEEIIYHTVPGTPTYISGGFRQDNLYWTIVATVEGYWWTSCNGSWYDITPPNGPFPGQYTQATNFTEAWNGTVPFFNDENNPPMFWREFDGTRLTITSTSWADIGLPQPGPAPQFGTYGEVTLNFAAQPTAPFTVGDMIMVEMGSPFNYNGSWQVTACTTTSVSFYWYDFQYQPFTAGFVSDPLPRLTMYSNQIPLGILNITYVSSTIQRVTFDNPPATAPFTAGETVVISNVSPYFDGQWQVNACTTTYVDVEMSPIVVYPGNSIGEIAPLYSWNYNPEWKSVTAKFMRIYNTPNVGTILVAGNLTAIDQNDNQQFYPVTVAWSQNFGLNEAPLTWQPTLTNVANQLEVPLRGEAVDAFATNGQLFLCSYWDTVVFSPINYATTTTPILGVRLLTQNRGMLTSNCTATSDNMVFGIDSRDIWAFNGQQFKSIGDQRVLNWFYQSIDSEYVDRVFMINNSKKNQIEIYYPTIEAVNGVPDKMLSYRYDIDCWNAPRDVDSATFACESPVRYVDSDQNWQYDKSSRTVIYARGLPDEHVVQKDRGYSFTPTVLNPTGDILSYFRRNNIRLTRDYSTSTSIHRVLPEFVNLNSQGVEIEASLNPELVGILGIQIEGQQSVGAVPSSSFNLDITSNTEEPWVQVDQNRYRVSNLEMNSQSTEHIWMVTGITYQFNEIEDDR